MCLHFCLRNQWIFQQKTFSQTIKRYPIKFSWRNFKKKTSENSKLSLMPKVQDGFCNKDRKFYTFVKSLTFTGGVCGAAFIGSSIWHYENVKRLGEDNIFPWIQERWDQLGGYEHKEGELRKLLNHWWNQLPDGERVFWAISTVNVLVFLGWKHPMLQRVMFDYFSSHPFARFLCWPMLLSTFSHYAPLHLAMNMYVLHSFSGIVCHSLGKEQFVAFYLAGGVISSFTSHLVKLITYNRSPSLGASGAIMALLGYFCSKYPDASLGIAFIPNFNFSAQSALGGVMLFDFLGIIFRWKLFDHAAHLGGAVFGLMYALFGQYSIWENRYYVVDAWKDLRHRYVNAVGKDK